MVEVFLDTDVAFDIVGKRIPFADVAIQIVELSSKGSLSLTISEASMANLTYLAFETYKIPNAAEELSDFIISCRVVSSGKKIFLQALKSDFKDKEDAIQYFTAMDHQVDYFITRNHRDYTSFTSGLAVHSPLEFLNQVS